MVKPNKPGFSKPMAVALVLLFFAFSFNAYACLIPINGGSVSEMQNGCSDPQEEPVRQICDSFKTLGVQAPPASNLIMHLEMDSASALVPMPVSCSLTSDRSYWQYLSFESPPREISSETVVLRL